MLAEKQLAILKSAAQPTGKTSARTGKAEKSESPGSTTMKFVASGEAEHGGRAKATPAAADAAPSRGITPDPMEAH
ncbi:hypothetical protein GWO43_12345 [candidate division KSB1 bacterium]|nr:hypothetical protein [candidate division KSB1 bacterium]NIR71041.1 hypothetical protein [candidate division KSB1 bacterium]NIT71652.1 hypothetical protein [candidate division KSB1 bacterium]NIU25359.1 hypothetical protein [candidate division KSB1 bacterium]NIU92126.1 hypothetical protein [candidate division KSB1 bacterium]